MDTLAPEGGIGPARRTRRQFTDAYKASIVAQCQQPGVSVAAVAMANNLNDNLLRRWVVASRQQGPEVSAPPRPAFVPVSLERSSAEPVITIEVQRGDLRIQMRWPVASAAACGRWLSEWLR